ncbi:winged helix-turn-helix domain-containing protein [Halopiger goleimassiliensis]|uniref:winged helix-turn-helix domain-containing protein n=1 Tax=Halopiger goleimassiliensis TaxID=1293048 RepID=UPI000677CAFB|nr:winged helix-turn-helix domain-containing protein [Halopiger goleimassiliensis]
MTEFDPVPDREAIDAVRERWREGADTFDRVYETALGITEPTSYDEIARIADCSPNAARKHLDRLADMGIVRAHRDVQPFRYERNDGYLEWQEASRIAEERTVDEIVDRVATLEAEREAFRDRFGASDPSAVSAFDPDDAGDDHDSVHERMELLGDWRAIEREIRLYDLARRIAQNDGHLVPV